VIIERFDGVSDTEQLRSCFDIASESWLVDEPTMPALSFGSFRGKWGQGFDDSPRQCWLCTDDSGEPLGSYLLTLPDQENTTMAGVILTVRPSRRRAGTGSALVAHSARQARVAGRTRLRGIAWDDSPGASLGAAVGARPGITQMTSRLDIDDALASRLAGLRPDTEPSPGYVLLSWIGVTPDEHLDQVARVHEAMADAPSDANVTPPAWDVDRIRHLDQMAAENGVVYFTAAAQQAESGQFAAITQVCTDPGAPGWGIQQITAVLREHRGHRLGLLVKIAMLELLARQVPEVRRVITGTAGSNSHMIAINEQLGFEVIGVSRSWELDLTAS
jgi:GNAT superfamily N-acetyltransferase